MSLRVIVRIRFGIVDVVTNDLHVLLTLGSSRCDGNQSENNDLKEKVNMWSIILWAQITSLHIDTALYWPVSFFFLFLACVFLKVHFVCGMITCPYDALIYVLASLLLIPGCNTTAGRCGASKLEMQLLSRSRRRCSGRRARLGVGAGNNRH